MKNTFIKHALATAVLVALAQGPVFAQSTNDQQMLELASAGETAAALALIDRNTDVTQSQADGTTALHWAIYYNDAELAERLIDLGADVKVRNEFGATPMSQAALTGNVEIIEMLLDAGAEADERGADDQTPLMVLARTPNVEAVKLLADTRKGQQR